MSDNCVYLEKVDGSVANIAISGLAGILSIPDQTAQQIVKSAPIILFSNLEVKQAAAVARAFSLIIEKGVAIGAAPTATRSEKPISWPQEIKVRGRSLDDYAFASLEGGFLAGGFSCPRCGEKFAILSNPATTTASAPAPVAEPVAAPVVEEIIEEVVVEEPAAEEPVVEEVVIEEEVVEEPIVEEELVIEEPVVEEPAEEIFEEIVEEVDGEPAEDIILDEEPVEEIVEEIIEEVVEEIDDEPEEEIILDEVSADDDIVLDDEPVEEIVEEIVEEVVEDDSAASDETATVEAPAPLAGESTFETIAPGSGDFAVRLKGVKGKAAKEEAAQAIQEIMGIGEKEAQKLLKKVIINAVKDVSEDEANAIAAQFEAKGITAEVKAKK